MAPDIDLTSPRWTSLIFEGKNKEYGAYEMRNDSSNRHLKALIIITILGLAAVYLPNLIHKFVPAPVAVPQRGDVTLIDVDLNPVNTVKPIEVQPPVATQILRRETFRFAPPVAVPDPEATEHLATQAAVTDSRGVISTVTISGAATGKPADEFGPPITQEVSQSVILDRVDQMPSFPGGEAELMSWLSSNITYPVIDIEQGIQGRVVLKFVVRPDGSIDAVQIVKSLSPSSDKEAIRAVKKMPNWIPGRQNGYAVSVWYTLPVQFKLKNQ